MLLTSASNAFILSVITCFVIGDMFSSCSWLDKLSISLCFSVTTPCTCDGIISTSASASSVMPSILASTTSKASFNVFFTSSETLSLSKSSIMSERCWANVVNSFFWFLLYLPANILPPISTPPVVRPPTIAASATPSIKFLSGFIVYLSVMFWANVVVTSSKEPLLMLLPAAPNCLSALFI